MDPPIKDFASWNTAGRFHLSNSNHIGISRGISSNPSAGSHIMLPFFIPIIVTIVIQSLLCAGQDLPVAHLTLSRRGGALARHEPANLTHFEKLVRDVERRYARAIREVKGNRLVRRWRAKSTGTTNDEQLLREPGQEGRW